MKKRTSSKLGPKAKKAAIMASDGERIACLIQVVPQKDVDALRRELEAIDGTFNAWMEEPRLMSAELDAKRLEQLAKLDGVVYVEAGATLRQ